jgi:hypothetical protein
MPAISNSSLQRTAKKLRFCPPLNSNVMPQVLDEFTLMKISVRVMVVQVDTAVSFYQQRVPIAPSQ